MGEKALYNRLNKYFLSHYGEYENTANWYPDNSDNIWRFDIDELQITVTLICNNDTGHIREEIERIDQ